MRNLGIAALAATALAGCASKSSEISASYVSPVMYQQYTCQQLAQEAQAVSTRAGQVSGAQDQKRTNDQLATTAAVVIFWPAAFFVGGDGQTAAELANLKGQMTAIEQASIQKRCGIRFQGGPPVAGADPATEFECADGSLAPTPDACTAPPAPAKPKPKVVKRAAPAAKSAQPPGT